MRRLVWGFGITVGVEMLATALFFVIAHMDSSSWLIYPVGALTVIPLPVALVFIFFMMNRVLKD